MSLRSYVYGKLQNLVARRWSQGIFVVAIAHQRSHADAGQVAQGRAAPQVPVTHASGGAPASPGLPDFSGMVTENGPAVVNIEVTEKPQRTAGLPNGGRAGAGRWR